MDIYADYNWGKIKDRLKDIEQTILGLDTPISKLVCNENGMVTDEKVKEFANAVISHQCNLNGCFVGIAGIRKRYFELFFYLVCRAYDPQLRLHNFADLLEIAEEMTNVYKCREEFLLREAGLIGRPLGFFEEIHESCKLLTGLSPADDLTETELSKMHEEYLLKKKDAERITKEGQGLFACAEEEKNALWDKYKEYSVEGYTDYYDAVNNWYWHTFGGPIPEDETGEVYTFEDEMNRKKALFGNDDKSENMKKNAFQRSVERIRHTDEYVSQAEPWKSTFENPQEYLEAYKEFGILHFYVNIISGEQKLQDSILYILEKEGFNRIGDDEKVVSLYAELNRALRIAKRKI